MITCVLFDMDGLLFNTELIYFECYQKAAAEMGLTFSFELFAQCVGIPREEANKFMLQYFGPGTDTTHLERRTYQLVEHYLQTGGDVPLMPGAQEAVELFYRRRLKVGLCSSNIRKWAEFYLDKTDLRRYFATLTTCEDVTRLKPDPEIYLKSASLLQVDPAQCLAFEDSVAGATAAIRAGMRTCMVPQIKQPDSFIREHAFKIYPSLLQVPADVEELLS
ncbi:MAG: HAD family phosphatase [Elusimicrobiaceae bacterium]|nr:HAD family phosphatase [Elusimicrobiaceae bacterium]